MKGTQGQRHTGTKKYYVNMTTFENYAKKMNRDSERTSCSLLRGASINARRFNEEFEQKWQPELCAYVPLPL